LSRAYEELGDTEKAAYYRSLAEENTKKQQPAEKPEAAPPASSREPHHE